MLNNSGIYAWTVLKLHSNGHDDDEEEEEERGGEGGRNGASLVYQLIKMSTFGSHGMLLIMDRLADGRTDRRMGTRGAAYRPPSDT